MGWVLLLNLNNAFSDTGELCIWNTNRVELWVRNDAIVVEMLKYLCYLGGIMYGVYFLVLSF